MSFSMPGVTVGLRLACGTRENRLVKCLRDIASAMGFLMPGTCLSETVKLLLAATRKRWRRSAMMRGCLDLFPVQACTIDMLSQLNCTPLPSQWCPHVKAAARIANNSCHWMEM